MGERREEFNTEGTENTEFTEKRSRKEEYNAETQRHRGFAEMKMRGAFK